MGPVIDRSEPPVAAPATAAGQKAFIVTPFSRMARSHAASAMADAMVAASLAGSLFFTLPAGDAREPVLRYLVITMLPFAVLSPLIGPLIDRMKGGHRLMVIASLVGRAIACYLMIGEISGGSPLFFLYALLLLVCQRAYQVARSALVPSVVRTDAELVEANSKLSLLSGLSGFVGIVPAGVAMTLLGPEWSLGMAMIVYLAGAVLAVRIAAVRVASESLDETERHELRGASIIMAGSAMGIIRACVGFLTLLVAFDFRGGDRAPWEFAVVGVVSAASQLAGAAAGPRIRKLTSEENLRTGGLGLMGLAGLMSLAMGDVMGATVLGASVGFAAGGGKLAFDSILQRDAPDANRGRAFARFETRFQVLGVLGALVPVAIQMDAEVGFVVVLLLALIALGSYLVARLAYAHRTGSRQTAATAAAVGIEERLAEVSGEVRGRLSSVSRKAYGRLRSRRTGIGAAYDEYDDEYDDEYYDDEEYDDQEYVEEYEAGYSEGSDDGYDDGYDHEYVDEDDQPTPEDHGPDDADPVDHRVSDGDIDAHDDDDHLGEDLDSWPAPEWSDAPRAAAPDGRHDEFDDHSVAWDPPDDEFPWEPPAEPPPPTVSIDDLDPSVRNPYPWSPPDSRRR